MNPKFDNFPVVYYISFETSNDRRDELESQFRSNNISYKSVITYRIDDEKRVVKGQFLHQLDKPTMGCTTSHLVAIKDWFNNSDDPYGIFFEDDVTLITSKYWNFSWNDFMNRLPQNWDCIQMLCVRENLNDIKFQKRKWDDWAVTAYMITRDYAKKLIQQYYPDNEFILTIPYGNIIPLAENIIYGLGFTYAVPLFIENTSFKSTFHIRNIQEEHKEYHIESSSFVLNWWEKNKDTNQLDLLFK